MYLQNVISQVVYNSSMYLIDNIFNQYKSLPRPIVLYDLKDIKIYQLKDIIHKVTIKSSSSKVMLMSGTPMTDRASEIAKILNLILSFR